MTEVLTGQVSETAEHLITMMRDENDAIAVGNVLRRTCEWAGKNVCKQACQLKTAYQQDPDDNELADDYQNRKGACADQNLDYAISEQSLSGKNILIVGVTANEVGFADRFEDYDFKEKAPWEDLSDTKEGWKELPGFNAFFAREGELDALGRRLADCADINFEFTDSDGNTVIGFEHGTRTNMFGETEYNFERQGKKVSFTEFVIGQAVEHYGADPSSIKIKLAAAIKAHNFTKRFDSIDALREHLPGWLEAGYVTNLTDPDWKPGDDVVETDTWEADTRTMIIDDIKAAMQTFDIPQTNFDMTGIIDPGDTEGRHSSHQFSDTFGDTRDLYMTYFSAKASSQTDKR